MTFYIIFRQETEHQLSKLCSVIRSSSTLSPKQSAQDHSHSVSSSSSQQLNSWCEREGVIACYIECLTIVEIFCFQLLCFCSLVDLLQITIMFVISVLHFIMVHCAFDLSLSLPPSLPSSLSLSLSLSFPSLLSLSLQTGGVEEAFSREEEELRLESASKY